MAKAYRPKSALARVYLNISRTIAPIVPKSYRDSIVELKHFADVDYPADILLLTSIIFSPIVGTILYFISMYFLSTMIYIYTITIAGLLSPFIMLSSILFFLADSRANEVERLLPDALNLISSNIEGGMSPYNAILSAARPELGVLEYELKFASTRTMAGVPFHQALYEMSTRIRSVVFKRTVTLLVTGLRSGGDTIKLMRDLSLDLREYRQAKRAVSTTVMSNTIFIFLATAFGAPVLFSLSMVLLTVLTQMGAQFTMEEMSALPIPMVVVSPATLGEMRIFAVFMIALSCLSSAAIVSLIETGEMKHGIKTAIPMMAIGLFLFQIIQEIATSLFMT